MDAGKRGGLGVGVVERVMKYDERVMWLEAQCKAAVPGITWAVMPQLFVVCKGLWNPDFPMFYVNAWAWYPDGREIGRTCEIAAEFLEWGEQQALEMALDMGRKMAQRVKEE